MNDNKLCQFSGGMLSSNSRHKYLNGSHPDIQLNLLEMEQDKLQEDMCYEGRGLYNILNFQDFILEESKKGKKDTKKTKAVVKKRDEFVDDMGDDVIDPNETPERFIKLREEFIRDELK